MTSRHLAEFWMLEVEWAFINDLEDVMFVVEQVLRTVYRAIERSDDMKVLWKANGSSSGSDKRKALEGAMQDGRMWPRITYTKAVEELKLYHESSSTQRFEFTPVWGQSLKSEHERYLAEHLFGCPVFVTDYPAVVKPFYMRRKEADSPVVACFDLLVPYVGELAGGSLREERLDRLEAAMESNNMTKRDYGWYLDMRKFGGAPHGGFGIGFERLVTWLGGIDNVRESIAMPRWVGRMLG
jgi:asparaginyl-tRNA synthetase